MKTKLLLSLALLSIFIMRGPLVLGQTIESDPLYPTINDSVKITFYVDSCNCSLSSYSGDIYAHTGVLSDESVNNGDWKMVIAQWNQNLPKAKLEKINSKTFVLHIEPDIRTYYGLGDTINATDLAFVFRSSDGSKQTANLYQKIYEPGLTLNLIKPAGDQVVNLNDTIEISAKTVRLGTPSTDSIQLFIDDTVKYTSYVDSLEFKHVVQDTGIHWIKVVAINPDFTREDSVFYYVRKEINISELPEGVTDGINFIDSATVTLVLHAPFKDNVFLIGDFNNWEITNSYLMNRTADGERYWITLKNLEKGVEYAFQYLVDGNLRIADPYTDKVLDPANDQYISAGIYPDLKAYPVGKTTEIASVFQTGQQPYNWEVTDFIPAATSKLVVYELLVRDFTDQRSFKGVMDSLGYLQSLGINAIELMPVSEFEGNDSWGYNPSFYFAVDKAYGTKNNFKKLVDECHKRGIAVFMDIVLNHTYGQSPMVRLYFDPNAGSNGQPTAQSPWYNQVSPNTSYYWGNDFNHESIATKTFIDRVNRYWMKEYKIDGFRFDFTKGFTNKAGDGWAYDASRIAILERMYDSIKAANENAIVIFEHLSDNSEETVLANHGILLWGKMTDKYNEATMGYNELSKSDFSGISYKSRGWNDANLVGYMESHDEQRLMFKNITYGNAVAGYDVKNPEIGLYRIEAAATMFFTIPGPKMVWQFGELGYDVDINYDCRVCRKPIRWEYFDDPDRHRLYEVFSALIKLRNEQPLFETTDFNISANYALKRVRLNSANMNATILANFDMVSDSITPLFQHTGTWYDYLSGDSIEVSDINKKLAMVPGEHRLYLDVKLESPEIPALGVDDIVYSKNMLIYPNPTQGQITIQSPISGTLNFKVYDLTGKLVYTSSFEAQKGQETMLDLGINGTFTKGIYLYQLGSINAVQQGKLIVR